MKQKAIFLSLLISIGTLVLLALPGVSPFPAPQFLSLDSAAPVLDGMTGSLPSELKESSGKLDSNVWDEWVHKQDMEVRQRLETGEEDTLTNLLRFGVTYTKEYRIDREYLALYGHSDLVDSFAENRADDLIRALASPATRNEGLLQERVLLEKKGFSFKTPQERVRLKKYMLANLARMRDEFAAFREKLKTAGKAEESQMYADRGISLDTNLWPDYALDRTLREMLESGKLKPGSIKRIAIVGPGLDFANKENGNDFYPPQTIQPFAVIDSLLRLKLSDPATLQMFTLDISPSINVHLQRARKNASLGKVYNVQLPWNRSVPFSQEYLANFTSYWEKLGDQIGVPAKPAAVPGALAQELRIRAVSIRPQLVTRITPIDMNIVFQRLPISNPEQQFDLVIGTNIFIYYGAFEQSLARANVAAMLRPGGYLLTNNLLADKVPSKLIPIQTTTIVASPQPLIQEQVFCYERER
jgi:hypothetical protein